MRVVDDRREDVDRLDEGERVAQPVDPRIVACRRADKNVGVADLRQPGEDALQIALADLARAAGPLDQFRQRHRTARRGHPLAGAGADVVGDERVAGTGLARLADAVAKLLRPGHDLAAAGKINLIKFRVSGF